MKLTGHTVLITGGSSGIGFEFARQLKEQGNTVLITGRDGAKLAEAQRKVPGLKTFQSDVSQPDQVRALCHQVLAEHPGLNVLINNAGIMLRVNLREVRAQPESILREIQTNLHGPLLMTQCLIPHLLKQSHAAIVNVTSGLAFAPLPTSPVYCAAKAALHSYTLSLRAQLQSSGVKVFEVAPPATETDMIRGGDAEDLQGIAIMSTEKMVKISLKGMAQDQFEICPGQANQLKWMSRLAPALILKQLSRPVERMVTGTL